MEFLQPTLLWGALAILLPVIIHFWYQKKGKTIAWAATKWLTDKTSLQHRGIRLDEIPLMLLRCLLILLFVLLLSKPLVNWWKSNKALSKIHLLEPSKPLIDNFRFELEKALKNGEKIYWIGHKENEVENLTSLSERTNTEFYLQDNIRKLYKPGKELNLYITNNQKLTELSKIYVPDSFKLHSVIDSSVQDPTQYIDLTDGKILYVDNRTGKLKVDAGANLKTSRFATEPAHKGKIQVLIDYKNATEQQTVQAALLALEEIYSFQFTIDFTKKPEKEYDWIFTDQKIKTNDDNVLYLVSENNSEPKDNVIQTPDSLKLSTSETVQNGQLPEWLGEILITHYKLKQHNKRLSEQQFKALFIPVKFSDDRSSDKFYSWLLLFFILTLILERWIALRKNVSQTYV